MFIQIPGDHLAAAHFDHEVEIQPDSPHGGGEIGDVPTSHLVCSVAPEPWNGAVVPVLALHDLPVNPRAWSTCYKLLSEL